MEVAAKTADVVREAKGPPPPPLPGLTAFIGEILFILVPMVFIDGDDDTACKSPANIPNG